VTKFIPLAINYSLYNHDNNEMLALRSNFSFSWLFALDESAKPKPKYWVNKDDLAKF